MHSDYEYESASLLYGHVNQPTTQLQQQHQPPPPPPCNKRTPDEQPQQYNTCCSEGNSIDRCMQSTLPGLVYKHHSGQYSGSTICIQVRCNRLGPLAPPPNPLKHYCNCCFGTYIKRNSFSFLFDFIKKKRIHCSKISLENRRFFKS